MAISAIRNWWYPQPQPEQAPSLLLQNNYSLDDQIFTKFSPAQVEGPDDMDSNAFFKDCFGMEKVLVYNGSSIYEKFQTDYDKIDDLEQLQQANLLEEDDYDKAQEEIDRLTQNLKDNIKVDFQTFLAEELGPERAYLSPEISYRFSQKAFTSLNRTVNRYTENRYQGLLTGSLGETRSCSLEIPAESDMPVLIQVKTQKVFRHYQPKGKLEIIDLEKLVEYDATVTYSLGPDDKALTEARTIFTLKHSD